MFDIGTGFLFANSEKTRTKLGLVEVCKASGQTYCQSYQAAQKASDKLKDCHLATTSDTNGLTCLAKHGAKPLVLPGDDDSGATCRTYVFQNESHTLGNALKCIISRYEDVQFCGYTVPHPAEDKMHFRIQAHETPALEILKRGLGDLEKVCDHTMKLFAKEVKAFNKT